jgi:uncharacterized peroxidase-related enzyme
VSFVSLITEEKADAPLKAKYAEIRGHFGFLPNYFQAIGRMPKLIAGHDALAEDLMKDSALPKTIKEQIGMVVSGINSSSYCVALHMEILRKLGIEKPLGRKLATDPLNAPVDDKLKVLFRFAEKLTKRPADITKADADSVRAAGWDEAALFETAMTVALFNLYNRVSIGLGLMADF